MCKVLCLLDKVCILKHVETICYLQDLAYGMVQKESIKLYSKSFYIKQNWKTKLAT